MSFFSDRKSIAPHLVLLACLMALSPAMLIAADEPAGKVPLNKVVMFSSGVGFFEHRGTVTGNDTLDLKFNVDDINDLLKSMVLQDLGGGQISTVTYGSRDPITKTLKTFSIDLTENPTLAGILGQIRGEKVELETPNKVVGVILGVEKRTIKTEKESREVEVLNLLTDAGLRSVQLESVTAIKLLNEKLDAELRQALTVLAGGHDVEKKTVSLSFRGEKERQVRVGYIQETPIWKTSYRLVLEDEKAPFLQGWAIVENTTEMDWNNVSLALVSGRPISFRMDLYQPLYIPRPWVVPELFASLMPQTYDQDLARKDAEFQQQGQNRRGEFKRNAAERADAAPAAKAAAAPGFARGLGGAGFNGAPAEDRAAQAAMDMIASVQSAAAAENVGDFFQYEIKTPVTLERQKSAMIPIVNDEVKAYKVSIYNPAVHAKHPLAGLKLTNSTDLHLMQGPITVFDDGAYAGDAKIQDLPPKSERLVSYAMDLNTEVVRDEAGGSNTLIGVKLVKGVMYVSRKMQRTRTFTVKNSGRNKKTVLLESAVEAGWNLVTPQEPAEKTRDMYRFSVDAEPGQPAKLAVTEERPLQETVLLTNVDDNTIRIYLNAKEVSDAIKEKLQTVIGKKSELAGVLNAKNGKQQQIKVIGEEQDRIRKNMEQLDRMTDLYKRYVKKFGEQEDQIESLRTEIEKLQKQEDGLRKALDEYLTGLTVG